MEKEQFKYLKLLSKNYRNRMEVSKQIVRLSSILSLTKGPEIFVSDIHGEYEAFQHLMRNGSGIIKQKINEIYGQELSKQEINRLAALIYYPAEKINLIKGQEPNLQAFYRNTLKRLIYITRSFASIYTNKKLQDLLPIGYRDIILEMVAEREVGEKNNYYDHIISSIIEIDQADPLIIEFSKFIQSLAIHKVHVIGDVYDRGPGAEIIMDELLNHHAVDFQWGNHDIVWMGAACGSEACMANVLRLSLRYGNTDTLEKGYGVHLMPLASFALAHYKSDESTIFDPKVSSDVLLNQSEKWLNRIMHKAISIIQFKLEAQLIKRRPEFDMDNRLLLGRVDFEAGTITLDNRIYPLKDTYLPTIDPTDPYKLSSEEEELLARLKTSFLNSKRLQRHAAFLFDKGSMYKFTNGNLLYHGCIPLTKTGEFKDVDLGKGKKKGKALMDFFDQEVSIARAGYLNSSSKNYALDLMWYLWTGPFSPLFGKDKMASFERYFINDPALHKETKDHYYSFRDNEGTCDMILAEFGLKRDDAVILNGHVPVSVNRGENPVKANGKLIVIDGGFSKAYQTQTGIAGYTLMHNAFGRQLIAHEPFDSIKSAIEEEVDIAYSETILNQSENKLRVGDCDDAVEIKEKIKDLKELLNFYTTGALKEMVI
jgi:fructose-1,6-bisphosphatase-3